MADPGFCQSDSSVEFPRFRPRNDPMATRDADAVRERLRSLSDSRGPINPLADYATPDLSTASRALPRTPPSKAKEGEDDESHRIPSLNAEAQQRLKKQPPSIPPNERHVIGLYPPPQIRTGSGWVGPAVGGDDGFRPVSPPVSTPVNAASTGRPFADGVVVLANYQVGDSAAMDPAAMLPPRLGVPTGNVPTYSAPPYSGLPPINSPPINPPPMNAPPMNAPPMNAPPMNAPPMSGWPSGSATVPSGSTPFVGAPGSNVIPAPPSYIVPGPNSNYNPPAATAPYAPATPTYSRSGGTVNSLPFVSPPPQARDARWMVSPEVFRRMDGGACATPSGPGYGSPATNAMTGSPFFYAPPTAMPMTTPRTAGRHSWLHPFRH
jgi:hypothetical protein